MFDYAEKETGYGWCVVGCSFLLHAIVCGIAYSCGVIHLIFRNYFNQPSHFLTSWIPTSLLAMTILAGLPATLLTYKLGYRVTVMIGSLIAASGMAVSAFATEFWHVLLTFGVMTGIGFGLSLAPSVLIVESYFHKKRTLATSFVYSGSSVGLVFLPILVYHLEDHLSWKGMALILSGLCLNLLFCGAAYRPPPAAGAPPSCGGGQSGLRIFRPGLCRSAAFVFLCMSNVFWSFGSAIVYNYLPLYAISTAGQTVGGATVLLGVVGLAGSLSRPMFQLFGHSAKLDHASVLLCSVGLAAMLTGLHPQMMIHKAGQVGFAVIFGLHGAFMTTLMSILPGDVIGVEYLAWGRGFITLSIAVGIITGPPLAGYILDVTDDYEIIFYLAGSAMLLSSCIMAITNMKRCYFRPASDWSDSESESSGSTSNRHCNTCEEDAILLKHLLQTENSITEHNLMPQPEVAAQSQVAPSVITCRYHMTDIKMSEQPFRYSAFLAAKETDV